MKGLYAMDDDFYNQIDLYSPLAITDADLFSCRVWGFDDEEDIVSDIADFPV